MHQCHFPDHHLGLIDARCTILPGRACYLLPLHRGGPFSWLGRAVARPIFSYIKALAKESERNRRCFAEAGAARVLSAVFSELASCNSSFDGVLHEILSTITCFLPLDHEACQHLGSRDSLKSIVSILKFGGLAARLNAVAVVREVLSTNRDTVRVATQTDGLI